MKSTDEVMKIIQDNYVPGASAWADKTFDGAWSMWTDNYERACVAARKNENPGLEIMATDLYLKTVASLIAAYKDPLQIEKTKEYLKAINGEPGEVVKKAWEE